ncbi:MAG TPA: ester cyclase family protein [Thermomicrobiales bacterium]|nr:ester cyclase family protein [Thermomicrobiales bacterium]
MAGTRFDRLSSMLATYMTRRSAVQAAGAGLAGVAVLHRAGLAQTASPAASPEIACDAQDKDAIEAMGARFITEGFGQGNLGIVDEIYAPDGHHSSALLPDAQDLEAIKGVIGQIRAAVPDLVATVDEVMSDGQFVVVRWTSTGTFTNPLFGFAPTGDSVSWDGINIFQFSCGKVIESWSEMDSLTLLGLVPQAASTAAATPSPQASPVADCAETTEAENREIGEQWIGVWSTGDMSVLATLAHPDLVHHFGALPDAHGVEAVQAGIEQFFTAFPDMSSTIDQVIVDGDLVAIRYTVSGTQTGEFLGVAPTGKTIAWTGVTILRIACGMVRESWAEVSSLAIWQQLDKAGAEGTPVATPAA